MAKKIVEMREINVYHIVVDTPSYGAAEQYGRVFAGAYIVEKGIKPIEVTGLYFQTVKPCSEDRKADEVIQQSGDVIK